MKQFKGCVLAVLVAVFCVTSAHAEGGLKGRKTFGVGGTGFFELSDYESLYVGFPTSGMRAAGAGMQTYFEYGFTDNLSFSFEGGYSRLLYSNKFRTQVKENFFILDALGHYYFTPESKIQPFASFGIGGQISSSSAAPTLDAGGGAHFMVNDNVSIRVQLLYKTAVIHNRAEGSLGVAFHF